jgi:hypothetical protein
MMEKLLSIEEEKIGKQIVNASFVVHKALGPPDAYREKTRVPN